MERATTAQARGRGDAVELWLWTLLAVALVLSAAHGLPTDVRDAGAVAAGLAAVALFVGRAAQLWRVA
jgi:hypothetical protein